jgi:hypothetical protein
MPAPAPEEDYALELERRTEGPDMYSCGDSWLKKNEYGLWEMYLEGNDIELGLKNGILAREHIQDQEEIFVSSLQELVPGKAYIRILKQLIVWMNRNMDRYVPLEYQREIYGVSRFASDTFDFIGPPYPRILNYHAAHDIGHALQNMNLVACTALGVKGRLSENGNLLVGRNFDFSVGEEFAREKIVAFYRPDSGHAFSSITWGGFIGVVSGMNEKGLAVSLNAAKSGIPTSARTPVSILARQILQYASTIEEAWEIATNNEVFVAESFLIASARDGKTVVIEKSPDAMALYDPEGDSLILTNHFQSPFFQATERTRQNMEEGASLYRWQRTRELLQDGGPLDVASMIRILRDQKGLEDAPIGMGNEKAINQLVAHHSVVFEPGKGRMWVSAHPYQLGDFLCYEFARVFSDSTHVQQQIHSPDLMVDADTFLYGRDFDHFQRYRELTRELKTALNNKKPEAWDREELDGYLALNPHYYYPWHLAGEVLRMQGDPVEARKMYLKALSLEIPRKVDREQVEDALGELPQALQDKKR